MKNLSFLVILAGVVLFNGCLLIKDKAYERDIAYYQAQQAVAESQLQAQQKPLATFTAQSGEKFVVNHPGKAQAPALRQHENRAWEFGETLVTSTPLNILAGGWAVSNIVEHASGDITSSGSGDITSTNNSNNQTEFSKSEGDMTESSNNDSSDNSDNSQIDDNSDNRQDYNNATATPNIVEQPDPVIVEQPEPIIYGGESK